MDHLSAVVEKYEQHGWGVFRINGGINDIIAQKGNKLHFVQVVPVEKGEDARFTGIARNTFVQNALSNNAIPVHGYVKTKNKKTPTGKVPVMSVVFDDVNTGSRLILGKSSKTLECDTPNEDPAKEETASHISKPKRTRSTKN